MLSEVAAQPEVSLHSGVVAGVSRRENNDSKTGTEKSALPVRSHGQPEAGSASSEAQPKALPEAAVQQDRSWSAQIGTGRNEPSQTVVPKPQARSGSGVAALLNAAHGEPTSAPALADPPAEPRGSVPTPLTSQQESATSVWPPLSSPAQAGSAKDGAVEAARSEVKQQSHSEATPLAAVTHTQPASAAALANPPVELLASVSSPQMPGQKSARLVSQPAFFSVQTASAKSQRVHTARSEANWQSHSGAAPLAAFAYAQTAPPQSATESTLPLVPPVLAALGEAGPKALNGNWIEGASRGPSQSARAHFPDGAIAQRDGAKPQTGSDQITGKVEAEQVSVGLQPAAKEVSLPSGAAAPAPGKEALAGTAMQSMLPTATQASIVPHSSSGNLSPQAHGKAAQVPVTDGTISLQGSNDPHAAGLPAAGDGKGKESAGGSAALRTHGSSGNNQAVQRPDGNLSTAVASAARQAGSSPAQVVQGIAVQGEVHAAATPSGQAAASPQSFHASTAAAAAQVQETPAAPTVSTAQLLQKMGEAEMRVAVHSTDYGAISIRTSVSQQQMMAQITVDHGELGKALTAHIPAVETRLGSDLGVRALVQVSQGGMPFSGGGGNAQHGGQGSYTATPAQSEMAAAATTEDGALHFAARTAGDGRLDIRA